MMQRIPLRATIAATTALALAGPAAAKDWKLTIQPADGQTLAYAEGKPVLRSEGSGVKSGAALMIPLDRVGPKDYLAFNLLVKNTGDQPVNFTLANVQVTSGGAPVTVLTPSDIQAEARAIEKRAKTVAIIQAFATGLQAASALQSQTSYYSGHTSGSYSGSSFGSFGSSFTSGSLSSHTSGSITTPGDRTAAAIIQANGQHEIRATLAQGKAAANEVRSVADERGFRPATIAPGDWAETALTLPPLPRKATDLRIVVSLNGETHTFAFPVTAVK
jgi:archaellum component FlaG (FlaF/FlaG flagellin family)